MPWIYLVIAGLFEIGWAVGLKYTDGFSKPVPTAATISLMIGSFAFLGLALRVLPLGTAYAVWTGIGTAGTVLFGLFVLGEPLEPLRLGCIALIVTGVIGLKLVSPD